MSEAAVTTSKGRGGRGKKNEDIEEVDKAQESESVSHKKGATKRKNVGKKDEESGIEENGQTETTTTAPLKKGGRGAKGKFAKTVDNEAEEIGDGDNVIPVEALPPKRGSRARKEVVYKEVDEDIDNKKKRGAAKLETKAAALKKNDKKSTKSKATAAKTKKKAGSEEEHDEEEDEEPQKDSGDELEAIEEKEETVAPEKLAADEDDENEAAEVEEAPPTKKARGGRSKPATKKDTEKAPVVAEKSSRKRGGKKPEEVSAVKEDEAAVPKTKTRGPREEKPKTAIANGTEQQEGKGGNSTVSRKGRKPQVSKSKPKTPELENVTVRRGKPISRRKLKPVAEEVAIENEDGKNVIIRRGEIIPKRKNVKDENVKDEGSTETKRMKLYELVPLEKDYNLKISTWNVAGLRAWLSKGGLEFINRENPDIICLQETKCVEEDLPVAAKIVGYHPYYLCKTGGYAGIAIYSKIMPMKIEYGIRDPEFDEQGRIMTAEFEKFFLICVYVPNSGRQLVNLEKRMKWNKLFLEFVKSLDQTLSKPVIICGDMNVSHLEIDLANPKSNKRSAGFTQEERDDMTELLAHGFVDTFRYFYPNKKDCYTYWTYMRNARARNVGWRLDYFIVSQRMISRIVDNVIRSEVHGSDHCPVTLILNMKKHLVSN